jgi:hypothetical protein
MKDVLCHFKKNQNSLAKQVFCFSDSINRKKKKKMHSAYGRGSHYSVIAGTAHKALRERTYYPLTNDYLRLHKQQRKVELMFMQRDMIFDNKFPEAARVNGVFRLTPQQRSDFHYNDLMPALRKRTILASRIKQQNVVNAEAIRNAEIAQKEDPRVFLGSPDSDVYFLSTSAQLKQQQQQKGTRKISNNTPTNAWPNFWQHPSRKAAVVPQIKWERHPELGNITRARGTVQNYASHY